MSTEPDQAAARKAQDLYRFDGSDPDTILALRSAFRAGAEFAAALTAPSVAPEAAVEAVARALSDDWNPGRDPVLTAMFRDYALTAALPLLTPAPSATREEVTRAIRSVTDRWDEPLDEVHDVPPIADAILARFTITPKETDHA